MDTNPGELDAVAATEAASIWQRLLAWVRGLFRDRRTDDERAIDQQW